MSSLRVSKAKSGALAALLLATGFQANNALADIVVSGGGDQANGAPYYQSYAFSFANPNPGPQVSAGQIWQSNVTASALSQGGTYNVGASTVNWAASSSPLNFFSARNYASLSVSNAQSEHNYYAIGGFGSHTTVQFFTADALASRANFTWRVTGTESPSQPLSNCNPAQNTYEICNTARLDFRATTNTSETFFDMFSTANNNPRYGPGTYTYSIAGFPLNQVISLMYWTSAFVQVLPNNLADGSSFAAFADYRNTYEMIDIELFDADDNLLTDWTMRDLATGQSVFNQDGVIPYAAVPEPASLGLLGLGLIGTATLRRRRRSA